MVCIRSQTFLDCRVAVPETVHRNTADKVQILVPVLIEHIDPFTPLDGQGHTVVVAIDILFPRSDDLCIFLIRFNHDKLPF